MKGFDLHKYMDTYRELEDSLASTVKISHSEVTRLVIIDLISKRNDCTDSRQKSFDIVLRWYLEEDEFQRFVINGEKL